MVEFPDDVCLILLKSHFVVCLECQITVLYSWTFKNVYVKIIDFWKKKSVIYDTQISPRNPWHRRMHVRLYVRTKYEIPLKTLTSVGLTKARPNKHE